MATLQNLGVLKYRDKDGNWKPLPVVLQSSGGGGSGGISTISGKGQPTESTVGRLNQLYRDESTDKLYICTGVEGGYTWAAVVSDTEDAVTYTAQTLTEEQKTQARSNIGAGTSNFSGSYNDLTNKPNIPAASVIDTTLTKSGYAADAKAAGDAIREKLDATELPTAINDALAQAKASGEFDGAKGDKGDTGPEGPKGDTGPEGPKGADGKDGAGMDVTGAKVGQIAKITAVDAAGKPTGWEAVDMPTQKTIKWITVHSSDLTETVRELVINADANGKAIADYEPIGLSLILSTPADSTQESNDGTPWIYTNTNLYLSSPTRVIASISSWKTVARDNVFCFFGGPSSMVCVGNRMAQMPTWEEDGYTLNGVKVYFHNENDHLPVGTHIEIAILCEVKNENL